jgi:hypothetical protein
VNTRVGSEAGTSVMRRRDYAAVKVDKKVNENVSEKVSEKSE